MFYIVIIAIVLFYIVLLYEFYIVNKELKYIDSLYRRLLVLGEDDTKEEI